MLSISYSMCRNFRPTSKFSSNLIVYLLFFIFCCVKKKKESLWNIFFLITQPFLYLEAVEGALKLISQEQFKNTTTKIFQVGQQFRGSTCIEYDMKSTLKKIASHFNSPFSQSYEATKLTISTYYYRPAMASFPKTQCPFLVGYS